ncbi:MAG: hypothetical protein FJW23_02670 [Acidimicrobiia bacterium]|nr:hypothetical protein [Acidimicrobiia bacterium]
MRSTVALVIVILVLNAAARTGSAYWKHQLLRDAAEEMVVFGGLTPTSTLRGQVLDKANKLEIDVGPDDVVVTREGQTTVVEASYVQTVEILPRCEVPLSFSFSIESVYRGSVSADR